MPFSWTTLPGATKCRLVTRRRASSTTRVRSFPLTVATRARAAPRTLIHSLTDRALTLLCPAKTTSWEAGSLPDLVSNLVKNWEVEASFKPELKDWRTIDHGKYTFSMNGGPRTTGDDMLRVGTYNALLGDSEYYSPEHNDFEASHKTFKRMMPTFAWEVLEVYSGPPVVAAKWRHWGVMKNDYTGRNDRGEMVRVKAHGGTLSIEGIIIAKVSDQFKIESIDIWYDPMAIFHEIAREAKEKGVPVEPLEPSKDGAESAKASGCPFAH